MHRLKLNGIIILLKYLLPVLAGLACILLLPFFSLANVSFEASVEGEVGREWFGDYNGMVKERVIRTLVPYSKTFYFLDGAHQRGLTYETLKHFEEFVNKREKT